MNILFLIAMAILGAVLNRVRGHDFGVETTWRKVLEKTSRYIQPIVFGIIQFFVSKSWEQGGLAAIAMFVGQTPGWGTYIGAVLGNFKEIPEQAWIDRMWLWLKPYPTLWGMVCLSTRGLFWGMCLVAATQSPWPLLAGVLMGPAYRVAHLVGKRINKKMDTWAAGEVVFGAILWPLCFI